MPQPTGREERGQCTYKVQCEKPFWKDSHRPFPKSVNGNKYNLVATYIFLKWVEVYPISRLWPSYKTWTQCKIDIRGDLIGASRTAGSPRTKGNKSTKIGLGTVSGRNSLKEGQCYGWILSLYVDLMFLPITFKWRQ